LTGVDLDDLDLDDRLGRQLAFVVEIDKVKQIVRRNTVADGSRSENDAEHQWHLAVMALLLAEHAAEPVDVGRVVAMVLVHDLVEIDAGDAFLYDEAARDAAVAKEAVAANRIFGILPADQGRWVRALWEEFEAKETPEARFAASLDRMHPILQNAVAGGGGWVANGVGFPQVSGKAEAIGPGSPTLLDATRRLLDRAVSTGALDPGPADA
jgi:putative hydrolase of HD superfamily